MAYYKFDINYQKPKKIWRFVVICLLIIILLLFSFVYFWYKNQLLPVKNMPTEPTSFIVESGDTPNTVADKLKKQGLIKNANAFKLFIKFNMYNNLLPGEYTLSTNNDAQKIADLVFNAKPNTTKVVLLPGKTISEYKNAFIDAGYASKDIDDAFNYKYPNISLSDKPEGQSLEGYLRPQTYTKLNKFEDSPIKIISKNLDETDQLMTDEFKSAITSKGLNIHQAFTLASIIQQEVSDPEIQKKVAQVFLLRLKKDISLGSDVTFMYGAKISGQKSSPDLDSLYNTRIHKGLPPGPIGTFNKSALDAVINPADGDYLFFVAGDDGNTYFSKTNAEHQALTSKYCIELCKIY